MPRRRFSRIKSAKRLGPAYTAYKAWQDLEKPYKARPAGSRPGGLIKVAVQPFGEESTAEISVPCSRRANQAVGEVIGARAPAATSTAVRRPGFSPAKAVVFVGTGTTTETTSEITNLSYQKKSGASYTHPFGGSSDTEKEFEAQNAIITAVLTTQNRSVSFVPERLYQY